MTEPLPYSSDRLERAAIVLAEALRTGNELAIREARDAYESALESEDERRVETSLGR